MKRTTMSKIIVYNGRRYFVNRKMDSQDLWNNPSERVVFLFKAIRKEFRNWIFGKSGSYSFTGPQIVLILGLSKKPYSTLNELSEYIGLSKSTVSGIVNRLVKKGVVIREIPENNRRIVRLSLSTEFEQVNLLKVFENQYINISEEELDKVINGLEILLRLINN